MKIFGSTKAAPKPIGWTPDEQQRVDAYLAACHDLSDAIVEHAGDYLRWRGRQMANCANRGELPAAAVAVLEAEGVALGVALRDGLARIDWLPLWRWLRTHSYAIDEGQPEAIAPLARIVDGYLAPLRTSFGLVLHPSAGAEWGPLFHQPLAAETWPGAIRQRVCRPTAIAHFGMTEHFPGAPRTELVWADVLHPIHAAFRKVADAAQRIETIDKTKGDNR